MAKQLLEVVLSTRVTVLDLKEHKRYLTRNDTVSLGWFMKLDLDEGGLWFKVGEAEPTDIKKGDTLVMAFFQEGKST